MKKLFVSMLVVLVAVAVALPASAFEVKYGGLFRARYQANDNVTGSPGNDNQNFVDQRLRLFFRFIASENLQLVTGFEVDTLWGGTGSKVLWGHRDTVNLETKHAYIDFLIPCTPVRAKVGLQPLAFVNGWIIDEDFTAANLTATFDPVTVTAGYISEVSGIRGDDTFALVEEFTTVPGITPPGAPPQTETVLTDTQLVNTRSSASVTEWGQRVDDWYMAVQYAQGPFTAGLVGFYQYGHNSAANQRFTITGPNTFTVTNDGARSGFVSDAPRGYDDNLFDLGINLGYKMDWANFFLNYVQNLGSYDAVETVVTLDADSGDIIAVNNQPGESVDYRGFMVEGGANFFIGPFTLSLGGFVTSGDDDPTDDTYDGFVYPIGRSHYWSEIMGLGTLENTTGFPGQGDQVTPGNVLDYAAGDHPTNLWTVTAGAAWQCLDTTKLTFNYYYIGAYEDVRSDTFVAPDGTIFYDTDSSIGHEFDFYVDQQIVDGLMLRLVGAYMIASDGYTIFSDDDDPWELGARLQWSF